MVIILKYIVIILIYILGYIAKSTINIIINFIMDILSFLIGGCAGSFLIYLISLVVEIFRRKRNKENELKGTKQFIKEWIDESKITLEFYIQSLEKFSKLIKAKNNFNPGKWNYNIIHLSKINNISIKTYFETYNWYLEGGKSDEDVKKLTDFLFKIDYVDHIHPIILEIYEEYHKHKDNAYNEWKLNYMELTNLFTYIDYDDEKILKVKDLIKETSDVFFEYADSKDLDLSIWLENYINPTLHKLNDDDYKKYPIINNIRRLTLNLYIVIQENNNIKNYSTRFETYAKELKRSLKIMLEFIDYFEGKKIKRWYHFFNNL